MDSLALPLKVNFNSKAYPFLFSISSCPPHCPSSRSRSFTASKLAAAGNRDKKIRCEFDGKVNGLSADSDSRFLDRVITNYSVRGKIICNKNASLFS